MFETIQGEGQHTGVPAIFLRLQGCPVGCSWCDTKHTWDVLPEQQLGDIAMVMDKVEDTPGWANADVSEILQSFEKKRFTAKLIVITGGEPCIHDLNVLTSGLIEAGYQVQLETSGAFEVKVHHDTWVTVSPKVNMKGGYEVLTSALVRANEIKHPVATERHIDDLDALLARIPDLRDKAICLQPISQRPRATKMAIDVCRKRNWRLSVQLHKYLGIE